MNMSLTPSRTNLLHLIALLLVCTMAFVTVAVPLLASSICEEWATQRDNALSDADTYDREASEYYESYQDASWTNPQKYYYLYMYHRALDRAHKARQSAAECQSLIDENCSDDNDDCG